MGGEVTDYRKVVETRRLYAFEDVFGKELPYFTRRDRSLSFLACLLSIVWAKHGRKNTKCPKLVFGEGVPHNGEKTSFAVGYDHIELVEGQRTVMILLHEITHTLGFGRPHGPGFVRKYLELLVEYGKCDEGELRMAMSLFKIA